ncbi:MAG: hypothetical protein AAGM21_09020 [Pseudomonadota bacterium]
MLGSVWQQGGTFVDDFQNAKTRQLAAMAFSRHLRRMDCQFQALTHVKVAHQAIGGGDVPGVELTDDEGATSCGGACPPPGEVQRDAFILHALRTTLEIDGSISNAP